MSVHVKGCRCEACLEGRNEQHVPGCLCVDCQTREAYPYGEATAVAEIFEGLGKRVRKAIRATEAVKEVLTPREREIAAKMWRAFRGQR